MAESSNVGKTTRQLYQDAAKRDAWWHCTWCGDHAPAEEPYRVGDKEPCTICGDGVAHVMTQKQAARYEAEIARGHRQRVRCYT